MDLGVRGSGMDLGMDTVKRTQWLATTVLVITVLALAGLLGRGAWLQKHVTPEMRERVARQNTAGVPVKAHAGALYFADGTLVASSIRMYNLFADPAYIVDPTGKLNALKDEDVAKAKEALVEALSPLVNRPADELMFELEQNATYANGKPRRFLWLAREVDENFYEKF